MICFTPRRCEFLQFLRSRTSAPQLFGVSAILVQARDISFLFGNSLLDLGKIFWHCGGQKVGYSELAVIDKIDNGLGTLAAPS